MTVERERQQSGEYEKAVPPTASKTYAPALYNARYVKLNNEVFLNGEREREKRKKPHAESSPPRSLANFFDRTCSS